MSKRSLMVLLTSSSTRRLRLRLPRNARLDLRVIFQLRSRTLNRKLHRVVLDAAATPTVSKAGLSFSRAGLSLVRAGLSFLGGSSNCSPPEPFEPDPPLPEIAI